MIWTCFAKLETYCQEIEVPLYLGVNLDKIMVGQSQFKNRQKIMTALEKILVNHFGTIEIIEILNLRVK